MRRTIVGVGPAWPSPRYLTNSAKLMLVAPSTLAMLSVDGQRGRPSRAMRLLLLKVVGSRPARRARPEADSLRSAASRSMAFQISGWRSIFRSLSDSEGIPQLPTREADGDTRHFFRRCTAH